ncbi:hypothetical protein DPEC_G00137930 [Dallia pectoralis]|uniref:Uncharacterized protein n=1 Tax=Dallia pectoralis TaxID=75939 RepID=A0ACC2GM67_DALPE|nr:hypothetical protein DPEC_G00137930 [Dallia pectoralis]
MRSDIKLNTSDMSGCLNSSDFDNNQDVSSLSVSLITATRRRRLLTGYSNSLLAMALRPGIKLIGWQEMCAKSSLSL